MPERELLDDARLEASSVVAHRFMNRERELRGANGYAREIGFDPLDLLLERAEERRVTWLDLCCGSGRALVQAAAILCDRELEERVVITGIDLAGRFVRAPALPGLELVEASVHRYEPEAACDLITCVHGLHYVGDKLGVIARAARWLGPGGIFVATFDVGTVALTRGRDARRQVPRALRRGGVAVDTRRHRVRADGPRALSIPWRYLGADDRAGPSFTGEPAVTSWYE